MTDLLSIEQDTYKSKKTLNTIKEHLQWLGKTLVSPPLAEADINEPSNAELSTSACAARLTKINQLTEELAGQVDTLHQQFEKSEIERLSAENEVLVKKIAEAKERLRKAEIANGKAQVSLPETTSTTTTTTEAAPAEEKPQKQKQQAKKKDKKKNKGGDKPKKKNAPAPAEPIDVARIDFRVGHILEATKHPEADKLYVETIDVGEETPRTILSGLADFVPLEEMQNRMVVICCNLKARKMCGIASHGMVMCAKKDNIIEPLAPPEGAKPGDLIEFEKFPRTETTANELKPKKKIFEQVQPDLFTNADGVAHYKGDPFMIKGKGPCVAKTCKDAIVS